MSILKKLTYFFSVLTLVASLSACSGEEPKPKPNPEVPENPNNKGAEDPNKGGEDPNKGGKEPNTGKKEPNTGKENPDEWGEVKEIPYEDPNSGSNNQVKPNLEKFDWKTCEIMLKEGHSHGQGQTHGNTIFNYPFPKEQYLLIENNGGLMKIASMTYRDVKGELQKNKYGYLDVMADILASSRDGAKEEDGFHYCMEIVFKDEKGERINNKLIGKENLPHHQIFYTISNKDFMGNDFKPLDLKTGKAIKGTETYSAEEWAKNTSHYFAYTYRDTNPEHLMYYVGKNGGMPVTLLQRGYKLPNKTVNDAGSSGGLSWNKNIADLNDGVPCDFVGLKGHFQFLYNRYTPVLPKFFLGISVYYTKDKKYAENRERDPLYPMNYGRTQLRWFEEEPIGVAGWEQVLRLNIPIRVVAGRLDDRRGMPGNQKRNEEQVNRFFEDLSRAYGPSPKAMRRIWEKHQGAELNNSNYFM